MRKGTADSHTSHINGRAYNQLALPVQDGEGQLLLLFNYTR